MRKNVLLLGASGSIGTQSLDIIEKYPDNFLLTAFSVGHKTVYIDAIMDRHPSVKYIYVIDRGDAWAYSKKYPNVKFFHGKTGLAKITKKANYDMCIDALVGFAGTEPAIIALKRNKILCLANKEALVTGGTLINKLLESSKGKLYPIDSEHVALAKCLSKCRPEEVKRLLITASGGALRNVDIDKLDEVKAEQALKHPTWKMGAKITIDCATMMNKGFEIIEAYYLYHYPSSKIDVLMHDESLVHSAVELTDGSLLIDYGKPDMHGPIEYAMFEGKNKYEVRHIKSLSELKECHFHEYDPNRYPCTELAKQALLDGASKMIALNAANEIAVNNYLNDKISYLDIYKTVNNVVKKQRLIKNPSLMSIKRINKHARKEAKL